MVEANGRPLQHSFKQRICTTKRKDSHSILPTHDLCVMRVRCFTPQPGWRSKLSVMSVPCSTLYALIPSLMCFQGFDLRAMGEMLINQAQGEMERQEYQVRRFPEALPNRLCPLCSLCSLFPLSAFFNFPFCCCLRVRCRRTHAGRVE